MKLLLCIALIFLVSCEQKQNETPLKVGFNTWPGYECIYLAKVKGLYKEQGVNIELVELNSLGDVRRAFERKQIDIMASTLVEALVAAENTQQRIKIIAVTDSSNGADKLLVANNSQINELAELKGKRVGMEGATVDVLVASQALKHGGLSLDQVQIVAASQDDLVAAIENGQLDAIQSYPPYTIKLLQTGKYKSLFDTAVTPDTIIDIFSTKESTYQEKTESINKFLKAYFQAVNYYLQNPLESAKIMGKREGIPASDFIAAINDMKLKTQSDQEKLLAPENINISIHHAANSLFTTGWLKNPFNSNTPALTP